MAQTYVLNAMAKSLISGERGAMLRASLHFLVGKHIKLRGAYNFARRFGGELQRNLLIPFNNWVNIPNLAI